MPAAPIVPVVPMTVMVNVLPTYGAVYVTELTVLLLDWIVELTELLLCADEQVSEPPDPGLPLYTCNV